MLRNRKWMTVIIGVAIVIIAIFIVTYNTGSLRAKHEPVPEIFLIYNGNETSGALRAYNWQGSIPAPNSNFGPPKDFVGVKQGSIIEFTTNGSRQPDYYLVTIQNITTAPASPDQDFPIILEESRLDGNKLTLDLKDDGKYALEVSGIWVGISLLGQSNDSVTYLHRITVTK